MAGRVDATRDLRLGLYALESGAINDEQLVSAVRAWARSGDRTLSAIFLSRGVLDAGTVARLEDQVTKDRELSSGPPGRAEEAHPPSVREDPGPNLEPDATVAYEGRPLDRSTSPAANGTPRFQVLRPHARGGLGEVFLAFDTELNRSVALKELLPRRAHDPDSQARFLMEGQVTGRLEHPGIVPVYSLSRHEDGRPYYAMRLIEGETLGVAIERLHQTGAGSLKGESRELVFRRLLRSVIDTCNAVAYAHSRGVIHRDLKPANIMLGPFGETLVVDWGIAKPFQGADDRGVESPSVPLFAADASMTQPGSVIGTPRYMSPEQAEGDLDRVGPASDIYSLGAILYCLLVGHAPFMERDLATVLDRVRRGIFPAPRRVLRSVDPALEVICLKAMALDAAERHASALDLAKELEAWQADVRYRGEQEQALSQVKGSLTRLCLERAHNAFRREAHAEGMLWLARSLESAPSDPPDLQRLIRMSLCGWHQGGRLMERALRHAGEVHALAFCPEGRRLATGGADQTAILWDVSTGSPLSAPLRHQGPVRALAFHLDGASVVSAGDDGLVRRWDAVTGELLGNPLQIGGSIVALNFSRDGSKLAVAGGASPALLWDLATGLPVDGPSQSGGRALAFAFSPDGTSLAVAREDGSVHFLDLATGRRMGESLTHDASVPVLGFDPSGQWLLTACLDGTARLWDLSSRGTVVTLPHQGAVHSVEFRPDGAAFATTCGDGTARLWETRTGRPIGEPLAHRAHLTCLAFRPDGTMLATGSADGTIRLWCAVSGLPIGPPLAQGGAVRVLVFSQDGRRLAAGGSDATVRCWKPPTPIEGTPERVSCWVRVTTELEFDSGDAIRRMDGPTSWECRRLLTDLGGPPLR